ncbi:hypothetical protein Tco_1120606 [Tanacetum coccineum]
MAHHSVVGAKASRLLANRQAFSPMARVLAMAHHSMVRAKASRLWLTTPLNSGAIPNLVPNSIFLTFFSMTRAYDTTTPMFVIMSLHDYFDGEYDDASDVDNVTLICKLDVRHPLHLHPNDSVALTVVSVKLKGTKNYQV